TIWPVVYLNLYVLMPRLLNGRYIYYYIPLLLLIIGIFCWINMELFSRWSVLLFPGYFFISYYSFWEICLFFISFCVVSTLLKFSKSWFVVNELEKKLLETEKNAVQVELKALRAQVNPHFFFNTLNSIYSCRWPKMTGCLPRSY